MLILIACEARMVARDTAGLIVPLGLPLLILFTSAFTAGDEVIANGMTALDLFVLPLVMVVVIASIGIINMPSFLAYYRRSGILRRVAVAPRSPPSQAGEPPGPRAPRAGLRKARASSPASPR